MTLTEKFRDPRWQKRRAEILLKDNCVCQSCFNPNKPVNVRMIVFNSGEDPWNMDDCCFQTVCEDCHQERSEIIDKALNAVRITLRLIPTQRLESVAQRIFAEAMEEA